ncbi:hypothetical protein K466DRAFT_357315 [Polyporus arcularius HHB13444]|uniref:Uncharacterized protein n=1 Tax=Polyporus arcularius HHB13444 TaxID=1314778 RepID=A0A5C3NW94_9APHY|nr:hypothetical protein K466DRAFT_357315 [Polyporus arcularius HHB13444]
MYSMHLLSGAGCSVARDDRTANIVTSLSPYARVRWSLIANAEIRHCTQARSDVLEQRTVTSAADAVSAESKSGRDKAYPVGSVLIPNAVRRGRVSPTTFFRISQKQAAI